MCRLVGVHARVATGFVLQEYDPGEQRYVVRERHAHAWTEVYTPQADWTIVDATPPATRPQTNRTTWLSGIRDFLQNLRFLWYQNVVDYDATTQRELRRSLIDWTLGRLQAMRRWLLGLWMALLALFQFGRVDPALVQFLLGMAAVGAGWVLLRMARRLIRRYGARWNGRSRRVRQADLRRRIDAIHTLLAQLARRGLPRQPHQTLREYADAAVLRFHLPAETMHDLIDLQSRWRWGDVPPSDEELRQIDRDVEHIRSALAGRRD
jgi:hypothetical protein